MASSDEKIVIDDKYRCAYCLQLKNELDDPRFLPCKHVFCHSCISSDFRQGSTLECPVCRVKHTGILVKDLPRYIDENRTLCHVCGHVAEMCCNQCSINVCKEHAKQHDETFASSSIFAKHEKAVAISARSNTIQQKDKVFCTQHPDEEIKRVCSSCYKVLCIECTSTDRCSPDKSHNIEKVQSLSERLRKELTQIMSELYVKSTVLSDLEKEANVILADQEKTFAEIKAFVDKVTEEQIKEIQEKANKIKAAIDETFKASSDLVNKYCAEIISSKDTSDGVRRDIHNLISVCPDLDVIQNYYKTVKLSAEVLKSMHLELSLPFIEVQRLGKHRESEVELSAVCHKTIIKSPQNFIKDQSGPRETLTSAGSTNTTGVSPAPTTIAPAPSRSTTKSSTAAGKEVKEIMEPKGLSHVSSSAAGFVGSVNWLPNQALACGVDGKIEIRDQKLNVIKSHAITGSVWSVYQHGTDHIILVYDNCYKVDLYSSELSYRRTIVSGCSGAHMAVRGDRILVTDNNKNVKLYATDGAHVLTVNCHTHIVYAYGIQFQDDCSFIVSDYKGNKLLKFKLEADSRPVWTCTGLQRPTGISIDTSGFIYVTSCTSKTIYLLTPSGSLLKTFSPLELYDILDSISLSGNVLAVGSGQGVQLFNISF